MGGVATTACGLCVASTGYASSAARGPSEARERETERGTTSLGFQCTITPHSRRFSLPRPAFGRCDAAAARTAGSARVHYVEDSGTHLGACASQLCGASGALPGSLRAGAAPSIRWFNASGYNLSGHSGQLDEFGIATGAEREELEWKSQGKRRFDLEPPRGPFGTKESPAIVESHYDVRIVGCSGGVGEDEHDVTWFHLEKGQTHECHVCTQVFELKVIGVGGQPGHDEHH